MQNRLNSSRQEARGEGCVLVAWGERVSSGEEQTKGSVGGREERVKRERGREREIEIERGGGGGMNELVCHDQYLHGRPAFVEGVADEAMGIPGVANCPFLGERVVQTDAGKALFHLHGHLHRLVVVVLLLRCCVVVLLCCCVCVCARASNTVPVGTAHAPTCSLVLPNFCM